MKERMFVRSEKSDLMMLGFGQIEKNFFFFGLVTKS